MQGRNRLILNPATMNNVVQLWLRSQWLTPATVTNVREVGVDAEALGTISGDFEITLETEEPSR